MLQNFLNSLSILKKFLFINLIFSIILDIYSSLFTSSQPNLIKKDVNHIQVINNTIDIS